MAKKTLEEYQIQEIARSVFKESSGDFVRRGEYDLHVAEKYYVRWIKTERV